MKSEPCEPTPTEIRQAREADTERAIIRRAIDVVNLIEGFPGYGTLINGTGVRLKDQPEWVSFYNAVSDARRTPAPSDRSRQ